MYYEIFSQMNKTLGQAEKWLDAAVEFAKTKSFEPNLFLQFRLAPDQFPLVRQLQIACDTVKLGASRLTGKTAPAHADNEATIDELRKRIQETRAWVGSLTAQDFADAASRVITNPRWEGKVMAGSDYFLEHIIPNFYFHASHTYALLRHNGVSVGKRDFLGQLTQTAPKS